MRRSQVAVAALILATLAAATLSADPYAEKLPDGLNTDAEFLARISGLFRADDPTSIYDFDIYDKNVEFVLDGDWSLDVNTAARISFDSSAATVSYTLPVLTQAVDLSSWIFIDNAWYFEADFAEAFTKNSIAFGYIGNEETATKHVRVGNSKISFPGTYAFIDIGGGTATSPGVMGTFGGRNWKADTVIRYDAATERELLMSGMNTVTDEYVSVASFADGKWFVLPDSGVAGAVSVYVQDDDGSIVETTGRAKGRRWRKLNAAEYTVEGLSGVVELKEQATGSVAVVYGGSYASGESAGSGLKAMVADTRLYFLAYANAAKKKLPAAFLPDPSASTYETDIANRFLITIEGSRALLIRQPGYFSPFEVLSRYGATSDDPAVVFKESGIVPDYLTATAYDDSYVEVFRTQSSSSGELNERTPEAMFPLAKEYPLMYMPAAGGEKVDTDLCVRARAYQAVSAISLGTNAIAGTITVLRNGVSDTAFTFNETTGLLELERKPTASETVKITWLDYASGARNATLTIGGGIEWTPVAPLSIDLASAFRWNVSKAGYTDADETSPGSFVVSTGTGWKGDSFSAKTSFAYEVSVPDTTGYYRILGMDDSPKSYYPSSDWYEATPDAITPTIDGTALDAAKRVALAKDSGATVRTITDSSVSGSILAMSCALPAADSWAAAEILAGSVGDVDFRSAGTVTVSLRNGGTTDDYTVYLQIGTGLSDYYEDANLVVTRSHAAPSVGAGWTQWTITLTDDERSALAEGCGMRLVVKPSGKPSASNPVRALLYSGPFETTSSGFSGSASPDFSDESDGSLQLSETTDTAKPTLATLKQSVIQRFNQSSVNTVLCAKFTPDDGAQTISLASNVSELRLDNYRYLSFFVNLAKTGTLAADSLLRLTLSIPSESSGSGVPALVATIPASAIGTGWKEATIDLEEKTIRIEGTAVEGSSVSLYDRTRKPVRVELAFENWPVPSVAPASGEYAYEILLDEFHFHDSEISNEIKNRTDLAWKIEGPAVSIGDKENGIALLSNPGIEVSALSTKNMAKKDPVFSGSAKGGISILGARADGTITASSEISRVIATTSHAVSIPIGPLRIAEEYAADFTGNAYARGDEVSISGPLSVGVSTSVKGQVRRLERGVSFRVSPSLPQTPIGLFSVSANSAFAQNGSAPFTSLSAVAWEQLWMRSLFDSLSAGEQSATRRTGKTGVTAGWGAPGRDGEGWGLAAVSLEATGESRYVHSTSTSLASTISLVSRFPISLGYSTLTPSWKRSAVKKSLPSAGGTYFSDTQYLAQSFRDQPWLYGVAPFADLFDTGYSAEMRSIGVYSHAFSNKYGLAWSRPSVGRLMDLWTPNAVDVSILRETEADATDASYSDEYTAELKCGFSALNVAGAYGALKIFPWYDQDEITQMYGYSTSWGQGFLTWNIDLMHSVLLLFADDGSVALDNSFHHDSPDIAGDDELTKESVKLLWKRPGKNSFATALLSRYVPVSFALGTKREDSLTLTLSKTTKFAVTADYDHVLRTLIGKNADVHVSGGAGMTTSDGRLKEIEIRLGIGGKLSY